MIAPEQPENSHNTTPNDEIAPLRVSQKVSRIALAVVAGAGVVAGVGALHEHHASSGDEYQANTNQRVSGNHSAEINVLAKHRFANPSIQDVRITQEQVMDKPVVEVQISTPTSPEAQAIMKKYAHNDAVSWIEQPELKTYALTKSEDGGYIMHGISEVRSYDHPGMPTYLSTKDSSVIKILPGLSHIPLDQPDSKIALFAQNESMSGNGSDDVKADQYLGTIELSADGYWKAVQQAPQLDQSMYQGQTLETVQPLS